MANTKGGKKGRKIGRAARHPAMLRYTGEKRWIRNKARRIARHERLCVAHLEKRAAKAKKHLMSFWLRSTSDLDWMG